MYKIETHLHTPDISRCAILSPEQLVEGYHAAGYAALTVTNHYNRRSFQNSKIDPINGEHQLYDFLIGYRRVKELADKVGMKTYYGAELKFDENNNEYLLFGFSDDLLSRGEDIFTMGIVEFSRLARQDGALLIQAHPFRRPCVPVAPELLDGVEIANRHDKHNNRNDLATAFCQKYHLIGTGGSDCHEPEDVGNGGILSPILPEDSMELAQLLRSGNFSLLGV